VPGGPRCTASVAPVDLLSVRDRLVAELPQTLDANERQFLLSLQQRTRMATTQHCALGTASGRSLEAEKSRATCQNQPKKIRRTGGCAEATAWMMDVS
jgi:hypothetical protein